MIIINGQLGHGDKNKRNKPTMIEKLKQHKIIKICCGANHTVVLTDKSNIFTFGSNRYGQLAIDDKNVEFKTTPQNVMCDNTILTIGCGNKNTYIVKNNGELYGCGNNYSCQITNKTNENKIYLPILIFKNENMKLISFGGSHTMIQMNDGNVIVWGINDEGQLGLGDTKHRKEPTKLMCDKSIEILMGRDNDFEMKRVLNESMIFYLCVPLIENKMKIKIPKPILKEIVNKLLINGRKIKFYNN